jgi:hypothetical protein
MAPPDIAMASNGDVAFVEHGPAKICGAEDGTFATGRMTIIATHKTSIVYQSIGLNYGVVVVKATGKRFTLRSIPPTFGRQVLETDFSIAGLRLADDGTPFITLAEGAGSTREWEWVYSWNGSAWRKYDIELPSRYGGPSNRSIGAVEAPDRFAVVGDYRDVTGFDYSAHDKDPTYYMDEAGIVNGDSTTSLGLGDVLSMRGRFSAGYVAPYGWCINMGAPTAVLWKGTKKSTLGPGIGFGVDANGDVVGDDRTLGNRSFGGEIDVDCTDDARPTLWRQERTIHVSEERGSALAIRNGLIVGTAGVTRFCCKDGRDGFAGGRAFAAHADDVRHSFQYLDDITRGDWTITSAFAIASSGRILAVGHGPDSAAANILILDPL